jgi:hypothetical protein
LQDRAHWMVAGVARLLYDSAPAGAAVTGERLDERIAAASRELPPTSPVPAAFEQCPQQRVLLIPRLRPRQALRPGGAEPSAGRRRGPPGAGRLQ